MARNALTTINIENDSVEEHIVTLFEKLESLREAKRAGNAISKNYRQPIQVEIRSLEFWRSIISECLASFFFVFIVSGAGLNYNKGLEKVNELTLATAIATGLSMAVLHRCFGKISGGHVNPAVSLAMAAITKISPLRASLFIVAQCGGGIAGAALLYGVTTHGPYPVIPSLTLGPWERFGVELVLTFIVVFAHLSVAEYKFLGNGSTIIGAAYGACTLAGMPMLNPARALGPAFVMNKLRDNHWVFWLGPILGSVAAAIIYEFIFNSKRHGKRATKSIDGDSSSIRSEDEPFQDNKYLPAAYRPVGQGKPATPGGGYCPSVASTSLHSSPPRLDRDSMCNGSNKCQQTPKAEGIYSGTRSLYNARVTDGVYSGTNSMYTTSPPLTRANLNRSQSVYAKSQNPRDLFPKPGPLIPAQSLFPMKLGNGGHLGANIRAFGSPNFISGIKTDGNFFRVPQPCEPGFNHNAINFLAGRSGGSRSYHDVTESNHRQQTFNGDHLTNQNVQNQHLLNSKPEKVGGENIYGVRNSPTGGLYPGNDPPRPDTKRETQVKRHCYDAVPKSDDGRSETPRSQNSVNFNMTTTYVKSVQNNPVYKTRQSNYDIPPSGIREAPNFNQKMHNKPNTPNYGSNSLTNQFSSTNAANSEQPTRGEERRNQGNSHSLVPPSLNFVPQSRPSPLSSLSNNSFSRNSPNSPC